jgi:phage-related protein
MPRQKGDTNNGSSHQEETEVERQRCSYDVQYFRTDRGQEPVAEWIDNRPLRQQAKLLWALERLSESGYQLGPPWLKRLDDDIWELRVRTRECLARVLFYERARRVYVLLHAFAKKTQRMPSRMLQTARGRMMRDCERGSTRGS